MGKWSEELVKADDGCGVSFDSWEELHAWLDGCEPDGKGYRGDVCPLVEKVFVLGCYSLFRQQELNETIVGTYSDSLSGCDFEIVEEINPNNPDYDLCALPVWKVLVAGEESTVYPEEIFVEY